MRQLSCILLLFSILSTIAIHAQSMAGNRTDKKVKGRNQIILGNEIHTQALNYALNKDFNQAIVLEEKALAIFRKAKIKEAKPYIGSSLNNMATFYYSRGQYGDYALAESFGEEALKYEKKDTEMYVDRLNRQVLYYIKANHIIKANALSKELLKQGKKVYGINTVKYAEILGNQSLREADLGNFVDAISYAEIAISIREEVGDTMNTSFARLLINTATCYTHKEDYQASVKKLERASTILFHTEGETGDNYIECRGDLSAAYNLLGDLQKADDLALEIENIGAKTIADAQSLKRRAEVYFNNGDYKTAASLQRAVLAFYRQSSDSLGMATIYDRLSNCYYRGDQIEQAITYCQQSIDMYQKYGGTKTDLGQAYNHMSMYHYHADSIKTALQFANEARRLYTEAGDTTSSSYATILNNAALYHYVSNDIDHALSYALRAYELQRTTLGAEHPDNVVCLYNIAHYYYKIGDEQKMQDYCHQAMQLQANIVKENFSHITKEGREKYWNSKKFAFTAAPIFAYKYDTLDSLLIDTYNAQLFTKGILLNSEIDLKKLIQQSGNTSLEEKFQKVQALDQRIADLYNTSAYEEDSDEMQRRHEAESLKLERTMLERELMRDCKEYGDYTANMNLTAEDIGTALREGEVAVELFEIAGEEGNIYYAMYLKRGWKIPRLVKLFSYLDFQALRHNGKDFHQLLAATEQTDIECVFNDGRVGQMVWNPLIQNWGDDVRCVYFSPSGLFYRWGIEYLLMGDGVRIGDKYNLYRLSSTKILTKRQEQRAMANAAIFGGINYDLTPDEMAMVHEGINQVSDELVSLASDEDLTIQHSLLNLDEEVADGLALRGGGFGKLPGAAIEVNMIDGQMIQHGIPTDVFTEQDAIEENFKALAGKSYSVIHVATHGFCIGERDEKQRRVASDWGIVSWTGSANDATLHYSGLLFAGANNVIDSQKRGQLPGGKLPAGIDNGILTAYEISKLDFGKVDMVVLSACQTGLGDIKEEGVFGLQRGFKKAGVRTLLMSLWSVNDRATQLMMTFFYQSLLEGFSRHEAFKKAQAQMRAEGFTNPYLWASFIMLDDL